MQTVDVLILFLSVLFQMSAAIFALLMISMTGFRSSWLFISGALVLMGIRRVIPLYLILIKGQCCYDFVNEVVGLVLSVLMLIGVYGIREIFLERKDTEQKIRTYLLEKELILKEVHHRIKNNISTIEAFLHLQIESIDDQNAVSALNDTLGRIKSMRFLYEKLLISDDYSLCSVKSYTESLLEALWDIYPEKNLVSIHKDIDEFDLPSKKLISLGIIINELFTNIMKYAFEEGKEGLVNISLKQDGSDAVLVIQDNGRGFQTKKNHEVKASLGMMLVRMLSEELGGSLKVVDDNGITTTIRFPCNSSVI